MAVPLETRLAPAAYRLLRPLACRELSALGAERRAPHHSLRYRRDLPNRPNRRRAAAATRALHLQSAARPRLVARCLGASHPTPYTGRRAAHLLRSPYLRRGGRAQG